jgi:tetratricopeptide (TPR) repeat protein
MMNTLDFQVSVGKDEDFLVEVYERGNSELLASSTFGYDVSFMTDFEVSRLDIGSEKPYERMQRLKAFGGKLFRKLFVPDIEKIWRQYKETGDFLVLCLRIAPEAERLEVLPWETLYDGSEFLAAGAVTGLTRLPLDIEPQADLPPLPLPLQMLALMSSPLDLGEGERLAIEEEQEILLRATNSPAGQGRLRVDFEDEAKLPVIESCLEIPYPIFHYSGHGLDPKGGGGLLLEDSQGKKRFTRIDEVLQSLEKGVKHMRLAVISGCQTARTLHAAGFQDLARQLARRKVPAVMAMQFSITDKGGLLFAESLYPRLAEGQPLDAAVSACRRILLHSDDPMTQADAVAPVLILAAQRPLKTAETEAPPTVSMPGIEFNFYVPLPQLNFGFYGRRKEYRAIRDGLLQKNQRAIIVHGIGGIGKTALISHAATRMKGNFKGVYAFDCRSGVMAPETILLELHRFLERLNINVLQQLLHQSIPAEQLGVFIGQVLSQIPLLIIFDNFETHLSHEEDKHQITDANLRLFLEMLIRTTEKSSRFLFTSRYVFDIDEKRVGPIRYLPMDDLIRPEALGLMQNLPNLAEASYRDKLEAFNVFGGHPYGLVTLDRHCGRKSLADALKDAKKVHQELREFLVIEINYAKLSERSRDLLNRLAAFRRPVPWDAVHWVIGKPVDVAEEYLKQMDRKKLPEEMQKMSDEELLPIIKRSLPEQRQAEEVDEPVRELINWGLLTPIEEDGAVSLLAVHSLVRDFCRDKCKDTWNHYLEDAAVWYTNPSVNMPEDQKTMHIVFNEVEAAELLMESSDFEQAAILISNVTPLLDRWGFGRFRESLYGRIIPKVKKETQAVLIHNLGILLQRRGEYQAALELYEKALKAFKEFGDRYVVAGSLHEIGRIHQSRGDYTVALEQYEKSLKILEEIGDRAGAAKSLHQIGMIHQDQGDYPAALEQYEKSLKIKEEIGDRAGVARSVHAIGNIYLSTGKPQQALEQYQKALKIAEEIGDRHEIAMVLHQVGIIHQDQGDFSAALEQYEKSLKILEEVGDRTGVASSLGQIGMIHYDRKEYQEALDMYVKALTIFAELQSPDAQKTVGILIRLRSAWGAELFDAAWEEKTKEKVPEWLKKEVKKE